MVYFMKYYMNFTEAQQSLAFLFFFACTILWIPLITYVSTKYEKRWAYIIFIGLWAVVQGIGGMLVKPGNIVFFYVLAILASGGVIAVTMINWMMIPDVVEVDEFKTGHRREGLYFGLTTFVGKAAGAVALWINGIVLEWIGYMANVSFRRKERRSFGNPAHLGRGNRVLPRCRVWYLRISCR